jgi:hypothetical protein
MARITCSLAKQAVWRSMDQFRRLVSLMWADDVLLIARSAANTGHADSPPPKVQFRTIPMSRRHASASDRGSYGHVRYNACHLTLWKPCEHGHLHRINVPSVVRSFLPRVFSLTFPQTIPRFTPRSFLRPGSFDAPQFHTSMVMIGATTSKTSFLPSNLQSSRSNNCVSNSTVTYIWFSWNQQDSGLTVSVHIPS